MSHASYYVATLLLCLSITRPPSAHSEPVQQQQPPPPAIAQHRTPNGTLVLTVTENAQLPDALLVDLSAAFARAAAPASQPSGAGWEYLLKSVRPDAAREAIEIQQASLRLKPAAAATLDRERLCARPVGGSAHQLQPERSTAAVSRYEHVHHQQRSIALPY